jgi:hypothetical protein
MKMRSFRNEQKKDGTGNLPMNLCCSIIIFFIAIMTPAFSTLGFADEAGFYDNFGFGAFQLRTQSPAQSLRFTMLDILSGPIKAGWRTSTGMAWTNTWADMKRYTFDYEMLDSHIALSYAFNNRFEFGVFFENRSFFGGHMDNTIQEFHDLFGIGQSGRDEVEHNLSRVIIRDGQGNILTEFGADRFENNGIGLVAQYVIHPGTVLWPVICVNGQLRYALKEPDVVTDNDEPLDAYIGIALSKRLSEKWHAYSNMGYTYYGQTEFDNMELESRSVSGMLAIAYDWTANFSLLVQYLFHEGVLDDYDELGDYSHEIVFGFQYMTDHGGMVELGLIENVVNTDNSPDVGLHFAYAYRF